MKLKATKHYQSHPTEKTKHSLWPTPVVPLVVDFYIGDISGAPTPRVLSTEKTSKSICSTVRVVSGFQSSQAASRALSSPAVAEHWPACCSVPYSGPGTSCPSLSSLPKGHPAKK